MPITIAGIKCTCNKVCHDTVRRKKPIARGATVSPILAPTPWVARARPLFSGKRLDSVPIDAGCHRAVPMCGVGYGGTIDIACVILNLATSNLTLV